MTIFFYIFASLLTLSSILVIYNNNPIYAMLWLIFGFLNATGLMILLGAEFIAMMFVIVYIGAVAVLFLFIIMMLTTRQESNTLSIGGTKSFYYALVIGILLFLFLLVILNKSISISNHLPIVKQPEFVSDKLGMNTTSAQQTKNEELREFTSSDYNQNTQLSNVYLIGENLYTKYILPFQTCGLMLFSTMIGAIYLIHKKNKTYKKQDIEQQLTVSKSNRIKLVNTLNKQGVGNIDYEQ